MSKDEKEGKVWDAETKSQRHASAAKGLRGTLIRSYGYSVTVTRDSRHTCPGHAILIFNSRCSG